MCDVTVACILSTAAAAAAAAAAANLMYTTMEVVNIRRTEFSLAQFPVAKGLELILPAVYCWLERIQMASQLTFYSTQALKQLHTTSAWMSEMGL